MSIIRVAAEPSGYCGALTGSATAGTIIETTIASGAFCPLHQHFDDEIVRVINGVVTFDLDGVASEARLGALLVVPPHVRHGWENRSPHPARIAATFVPAGAPDPFQDLESPSALAALALSFWDGIAAATSKTDPLNPKSWQ